METKTFNNLVREIKYLKKSHELLYHMYRVCCPSPPHVLPDDLRIALKKHFNFDDSE